MADVAAELISRTCLEGKVDPRGVVLRSDNGKAMRGNTKISTSQLAGVNPVHPSQVSAHNPYSEAPCDRIPLSPHYESHRRRGLFTYGEPMFGATPSKGFWLFGSNK